MSFTPTFDEVPAWGTSGTPKTADLVQDALKKEALIKEIVASQNDLRDMLSRVQSLQKEVDKLTTGNQTLQMYIDNLTVQMAKRRQNT